MLELNAADGSIVHRWPTGQDGSHMVVATPDDRKLYVTNVGSGTVTVIDRWSGKTSTIATGAGAEGIDIDPSGEEEWVSNSRIQHLAGARLSSRHGGHAR